MKICICDDEQNILKQLKKQLNELLKEKNEIYIYDNTKDLLENLKSNKIDVLFMDIKLNDNNGIEFIKKNEIYLKNTKIVYITGYSEYIEDIFETNPIYFLNKPITIEKLNKVIEKIKKLDNNKYIVINKGNEIEKVNCNDILFIESYARILNFHLTDNTTLETYSKLSDIIKSLPSTFIKIHKSYIINVEKIKKYKVNRIVLLNNQELPISRLNKEIVKKQILEYIKESE